LLPRLFVVVFNIKSQEARIVHLTPSDTWGGAGLLGVTIRLDNYAGAEDRFIRVISVDTENGNSPAAVAGLLSDGTDFILGTTHHTINSVTHFAQLLRVSIDRVVELYVYNSATDIVRVVALMPTYEWNKKGGNGLLGAEVGTGYLHRLPYKSRSTLGSCVERKVRYVPTTLKEDNVVLLEDAPQMEMEPPDTDDDDNSDKVEEVYSEPKRATREVAVTNMQSSLSPLLERLEEQQHENQSEVFTESVHKSSSTSQPENALNRSFQQQQQHHGRNAVGTILPPQPFVPPPLFQNRVQAQHSMSPLGPPPPPYFGGSSSVADSNGSSSLGGSTDIAPQSLSFQQQHAAAPQQSHYYGGPPPVGTSSTYNSTQNGVPAYSYANTASAMPPPPVGSVWNQPALYRPPTSSAQQ
jgi:GRASP55/65 PDZ-like domain